jgi:hypothetical protein
MKHKRPLLYLCLFNTLPYYFSLIKQRMVIVMAVKSIQVLKVGMPCEEDKDLMTFMKGNGDRVMSGFFSYLIKTDQGNVLVDTGINPDDVPFFTRGKVSN